MQKIYITRAWYSPLDAFFFVATHTTTTPCTQRKGGLFPREIHSSASRDIPAPGTILLRTQRSSLGSSNIDNEAILIGVTFEST